MRLQTKWQSYSRSLEPIPRGTTRSLWICTRLALAWVSVALPLKFDRWFLTLLTSDGFTTSTCVFDLGTTIAYFVAHTPVTQVEWLIVVFAFKFIFDVFSHVEIGIVDEEVGVFLNFTVKFVFFSFFFSHPHSVDLRHHGINEFFFRVAYDLRLACFQVKFETHTFIKLAQTYYTTFVDN